MFENLSLIFVSAPGLEWQAALKKTKVKLELLTDNDMLLTVERRIRGRICHVTHRCAKANNKYMKEYDKYKKSSYIKYWDINKFIWLGNPAKASSK